jgi:WD40 repeat protein
VSKDKSIKIWSVETGAKLRTIDIEEDEPTCAMVLNQYILLMGSTNHGRLRAWKVDSGIQDADLPMENASKIYALMPYRNDMVIVATNRNVQIRLLNMRSVELMSSLVSLFEGDERGVRCMAFFGGQESLITGGVDGTVRFWNIETRKCYMKLYSHMKAVLAIVVIDSGKIITSSADSKIVLWNVKNGEALRTFSDHSDWVNSLVLRQNRLVSCSDDHTIRVWNVSTRECEKVISEHANNVLTLLVAKNGALVSTSCDGFIKIWN